MTVVDTPEEAEREVLAQTAAGYDFVKTYDRIDAASFAAVVEAAAAEGLVVAGHVPDALSVTDVLGLLHTIEHLDGYVDPDAARLLVTEADLPAVAAGTRDAAVALGLAGEIGTVAPGHRADLLLVDGDPLADVAHLHDPAGVMLGGRWLPRERLDALLEGLSPGTPPPTPGGPRAPR